VSGLVLVTGAAGGGPGPAGRRMAGLLLDRGVRCVPSHRRETTVLSTFGSPAPRWPPGICARSRTSSSPSATETVWVGQGFLSAKFRLDFRSRQLRVLEVGAAGQTPPAVRAMVQKVPPPAILTGTRGRCGRRRSRWETNAMQVAVFLGDRL